MFCVRCGAKLDEGSKFCMMCGTAVAQPAPAPAPVPDPVPVPVAEPVPVAPVIEDIPFAPFVEEVPAAEESAYDPIMEEATVSHWMGDATVVYRAGKTPIPPVVKQKPAEEVAPAPVEEEKPVAPVVEVVPVVEFSEEIPAACAMDAVPLVPVMDESIATPAFEPMMNESAPAFEPIMDESTASPAFKPMAPAAETESLPEDFILTSAPAFVPSPEPIVAEPIVAEPIAEKPIAAEPIVTEPAPVQEPAVENAQPKAKDKPRKTVSRRRKPHIAVRILLQLLSFVLCVILTAGLLGAVVLADLNYIMSKNGMEQLVNAVLVPTSPKQAAPVVGAAGMKLDAQTEDETEDSQPSTDDLISWIYQQVAASSDKPLTITEEQIKEFIQESDISEYIAEKMAGYTEDFINGTANTSITTQEILAVLEENEDIIEEAFDIQITEETKANMEKSIDKLVQEQDINNAIRQQVFTTVENTINQSMASTGMTWEQLQPIVKMVCSNATLYIVLAICLVLMLLLCTLNSYNIPGGLTWIAVPCMLIGGILTGGLALAPMLPNFIPAIPVAVVEIVSSFSNALLPIHAAVLGLGVLLLMVAIIWRAIRKAVERKREALV